LAVTSLGLAAGVSAAVLLSACGVFDTGCNTYGVPGLSVTLRDSSTSAPTAAGATVTVVDGSFREVHQVPTDVRYDDAVVTAVVERPGRYTVMANKQGYQPWVRSEVTVAKHGCHVITTALAILLVPS
jgi:hypothetical protein